MWTRLGCHSGVCFDAHESLLSARTQGTSQHTCGAAHVQHSCPYRYTFEDTRVHRVITDCIPSTHNRDIMANRSRRVNYGLCVISLQAKLMCHPKSTGPAFARLRVV
jgi:hypothetical protein